MYIKNVYVCSDSVGGIFSAIYDAWKSGNPEEACSIALKGSVEAELFCAYVEVEETEQKARAVDRLIRRHLGMTAYVDIYQAVLAPDKDKGDAVLGTIFAARMLRDSQRVMEHLSHPKVGRVFELSRRVGAEAHAFKGFVRFRELSDGILYSEIEPKAQVLTCLAPHFAERLPMENWMIFDKTHDMYVVHEAGKQWVLVQNETIDEEALQKVSDQELIYEQLWREFCRMITIEERENRKGQRGHLPLRYRPHMVEF